MRQMVAHVGFVLALVAFVFVARADRRSHPRVPYTIVLTVFGLIYAVLPGPNLHVEPEIILVVLIPPLLFGDRA